MAENGRIRHHLKYNIEDKRNTVLIVSWQAPETLGRRIVERQPKLRIFGDYYKLKAEVATIGGLSAHGGKDFLLEYAMATQETVKTVFLVHGEEKASIAFQEYLAEAGFRDVRYPELHSVADL